MMEDAFAQMCTVSPGVDSPTAASATCSGSSGEARTLRRRRSAASAALLARPSLLTLGELEPSFETCVLVHISTSPNQRRSRVVYALFEPNFLVDGVRRAVRKLERTEWERLRAHVEDLRIVALSPPEPLSPNSSGAPARKPDCVFDLSTDPASEQCTTSLYLQPQPYTAIPARSKAELLQIEIRAPADVESARERRTCLPAQVRAVLADAEEALDPQHSPPTSPLLTPPIVPLHREQGFNGSNRFDATCERILRLVEGTTTAS